MTASTINRHISFKALVNRHIRGLHAKRAAHEYIPTEEDYKKFKQTQKVHKPDNLTIVETTRESE